MDLLSFSDFWGEVDVDVDVDVAVTVVVGFEAR